MNTALKFYAVLVVAGAFVGVVAIASKAQAKLDEKLPVQPPTDPVTPTPVTPTPEPRDVSRDVPWEIVTYKKVGKDGVVRDRADLEFDDLPAMREWTLAKAGEFGIGDGELAEEALTQLLTLFRNRLSLDEIRVGDRGKFDIAELFNRAKPLSWGQAKSAVLAWIDAPQAPDRLPDPLLALYDYKGVVIAIWQIQINPTLVEWAVFPGGTIDSVRQSKLGYNWVPPDAKSMLSSDTSATSAEAKADAQAAAKGLGA